ncbi:MAG: TIGR02217 family protein [Alphaproteobacteria bacterium]|nr:TIGR02217 family protein [Alphaproteobacteria bacterium]
MIEEFQDILFPQNLGFSASRTIERFTEIQNFLSGREQRNARKYHSKRKYMLGVAAKSFVELEKITEFYEARRGALIGFKWHDILDYKSCDIEDEISATDQKIGIYDGEVAEFQLSKTYGDAVDDDQNYIRKITKPYDASLRIAVNDVELNVSHFGVEVLTGIVTILPSAGLVEDDVISAGFEFDVAVRFAEHELKVDYSSFKSGEIAQIPLIEILD